MFLEKLEHNDKPKIYLQKKCLMHHQPFVIAYEKAIPQDLIEAAIEFNFN